jgi:hypothetical protein
MKKYTNYIVGGVVLLIVIIVVVLAKNGSVQTPKSINEEERASDKVDQVVSTTASSTTQIEKKTTPKAVSPVTKPSVSKPAPQSYTDAIEKYKNSGYYIQFFPCQATPGSLIVKQGSKIMLDNRDSKAHSIGIKSDKYLIASYNYAIATLNVIGTNYVTCDGGGSATITVVP